MTLTERTGIGMTSQRTRNRLVERLREGGIRDERVLAAIAEVPRHLFVDEALASRAYEDTALPIGCGQTISQPWVVALMTQALLADAVPERVLEVGTGSGYQAAVLAHLCRQVFSVERIDELGRQARRRFRQLGLRNIRARWVDGNEGWPANAPYDGILITAATSAIPDLLLEQLSAEGGVLVAPVGAGGHQRLLKATRRGNAVETADLGAVTFVPMLQGTL